MLGGWGGGVFCDFSRKYSPSVSHLDKDFTTQLALKHGGHCRSQQNIASLLGTCEQFAFQQTEALIFFKDVFLQIVVLALLPQGVSKGHDPPYVGFNPM